MSQSDPPNDQTPTTNRALSAADQHWIRARPDLQRHLPNPSEQWKHNDKPFDRSTLRQLQKHNIIEHVERVSIDPDNRETTEVWAWHTTPGAWELMQSFPDPDDDSICPNGRIATGIQNLGDEGYSCNHDDCDCRMSREQALQILKS